MPTYDYRCEACGHELAIFHSITDAPKRTCPKCGKKRLKRLIGSGAGIIFKGSGFYETDYKRARSGGGEGKKDAGKSDAKTSEPKKDASPKKDAAPKRE